MNKKNIFSSQPSLSTFLSGGGEMGALMRNKNWEATSIGALSTWPQSLKTTVSILLHSKFPMFLFWGKDLICFYNNAYRPSLGNSGKHPEILGMEGEKAWPEIWHIIHPLINQVLAGGEATWSEDQLIPIYRNGAMEDVYWTFSYSAVTDESAGIAGVFVTCSETTDKVINTKKLQAINDELAFAVNAVELGTYDYNPITNTFSANERLKSWFGLTKNSSVDLQIAIDAIAEKDRQKVSESINESLQYNSGGKYNIDYTIVNPSTKKEIVVRAKGQALFNDEKIAYRLSGTLQDITANVHAIGKIKESEENLRLIISQASVSIAIFRGKDYVVEIANSKALELWGRREEDVIGKPILDAMPELKGQSIKELLDNVFISGKTFSATELPVTIFRNGAMDKTYINFTYNPLYNSDTDIDGIITVGTEVTEQVHARKEIEHSEQRVRAIVESAPFPIGVYTGKEMRIALANQSIMDVWGKGNNVAGKLYAEILPELENQEIFDQLASVYNSGIPFRAVNQRVDINIKGILQSFYFNYNFTPLYNADGKIYGVMNTAADVTEINIANKKLEESELRFRNAVRQAPTGIVVLRGSEYIVELVNNAYCEIVYRTEEQLTGKSLFTSIPEAKDVIVGFLDNVMQTGIPYNASEFPVILNRRGKNETVYFNFMYHPLHDSNDSISGIMVIATDVSDIVRTKQGLAESEKQFRNLVTQSPIAMAILKEKDLIIDIANKVMIEHMWRRKPEDVLGKKLLDVFPELHGQKYPELLYDIYTSRTPKRETESVAFIDGPDGMKKFYLDYEYAPLFETDNTVSGIIITVIDTTEKVEARLKVEDAEERLRIATEAAELATWEVELAEKKLIHSPKLNEIFNFDSTEKLTHEKVRSCVNKQDLQEVIAPAYKKAFETGYYFYEARISIKSANDKWIRTQGKVLYDAAKNPVRMVGIVQDISEEKRYRQELEEREEKFRLLADSIPQLIWTSDDKGNINYYNEAMYNYSGISYDLLQQDGWFQIVHPDDKAENIRLWMESVRTGKQFVTEHRFLRSDGEYRWQLSRALPQKDADGNIQMWVGSSTDIQELKKQEEEKDFFISIASHELKTPVTSIKAYIQLLLSKYKNEDEFLEKSLSNVDRQITKLTTLISDMLDLSKIKTGNLYLRKENFNINQLIAEIIDWIEHINPSYSIHFSHDENSEVYGDKERIGQVVTNFLTNAIKYSPKSREIKITAVKENQQIIVSVEDFGIGINKTDQEKIFNRFYRVEGTSEKTFPGFGIGLFICQEIIQRHSGHIGVISEPGKGSVFYFTLPVIN